MNDDEKQRALLDIATTMADGHPIDWEGVLGNYPGLEQEIEALRVLQAIAGAPQQGPG